MDLRSAINICYQSEEELPYSIVVSEKDYFKNISRFRNDICGVLPKDILAYHHQHKDVYLHATSRECAEEILSSGYLELAKFKEYGAVGRAIYTFPLNSGRCISGEDDVIIMFESDAKHYHVVGVADQLNSFGECVFLEDTLYVKNAKVMNLSEYMEMTKDLVLNETDLRHYFGINEIEQKELGSSEVPRDKVRDYVLGAWEDPVFCSEFYQEFSKEYDKGTVEVSGV